MTARGRRKSPEQDAVDHIIQGKDKPILEEKFIDTFKGKLLISYHVLTPLTITSQQLKLNQAVLYIFRSKSVLLLSMNTFKCKCGANRRLVVSWC